MVRVKMPVSSMGQGNGFKIISHNPLTLDQTGFITLTLFTLLERSFSWFVDDELVIKHQLMK